MGRDKIKGTLVETTVNTTIVSIWLPQGFSHISEDGWGRTRPLVFDSCPILCPQLTHCAVIPYSSDDH
jgi:hypothetical protein